MKLGKIFKTQQNFSKSFPTGWLIDQLCKSKDSGEKYDTIELTWVFSLIISDGVYPVHLYVKWMPNSFKDVCDTKLSFTEFKKRYANRGYDLEKCNADPFLKCCAEAFLANDSITDLDIELSPSFSFDAQSTKMHEDKGYGRTSHFYIVGMRVDKNIKK